MLLRAFSGPWELPTERSGLAPAEVAVYRDGTVLADVSPVWDIRDVRAIQLRPEELAELMNSIVDAEPQAVDHASSANSACFDAGVQVIQVRVDGEPTELAIYCLDTRIPIVLEGTPESAVVLSRLLDDLQQLVSERPALTTDKPMPLVPAAPHTGG